MNEIQQEIPQAPEIETAVLGVLLTDNNCIPENIDKIQIEFFANPVNQIIFSAIKEMYLLGKDVDILTLTIYLKNKNRLNEVGGAPFISDLTNVQFSIILSKIRLYCVFSLFVNSSWVKCVRAFD